MGFNKPKRQLISTPINSHYQHLNPSPLAYFLPHEVRMGNAYLTSHARTCPRCSRSAKTNLSSLSTRPPCINLPNRSSLLTAQPTLHRYSCGMCAERRHSIVRSHTRKDRCGLWRRRLQAKLWYAQNRLRQSDLLFLKKVLNIRTDRKRGAGVLDESVDLARPYGPYPQRSSDGLKVRTDKFGAKFGSQGGKATLQ